MARIDEIYQEIDAARQAALPQLNSPSKTAEYKLWQLIFSAAQANAEGIIAVDKTEIQTIVDNNRIGTGPWLVQMAKQFQWSEDTTYYLIVDTKTGQIRYNRVVPEDRIITQAAYVETDNGVRIKVATGTPGSLRPITPLQLLNLENYLRQLKIAGIRVEVVNLPADLLELACDVYYNPAYNNNLLKQAVIDSLNNYSIELQYDGVILRNAVIDAIQRVAGVKDAQINSLYGLQGTNRTEIARSYTTLSGYFNIKTADDFPKINLIAG